MSTGAKMIIPYLRIKNLKNSTLSRGIHPKSPYISNSLLGNFNNLNNVFSIHYSCFVSMVSLQRSLLNTFLTLGSIGDRYGHFIPR